MSVTRVLARKYKVKAAGSIRDVIKYVKDRGPQYNMKPIDFYKDKHGLVWYADFHNCYDYGENKITDEIRKDIRPYRMTANTRLFRGLFWADLEYMDDFLQGATEGDAIPYACGNRDIESWTAVKDFAHNWAQEEAGYGAVIGAVFAPHHTLLDTDMLPPEFKEALKYGSEEQEVLVASCPSKVEIIKIYKKEED